MIKIENAQVVGWDHAIRGMRNPMNSWDKSDSYFTYIEDEETMETAPFAFYVGSADLDLMKKLVKAGTDHSKFMRYIVVYADIVAPDYWFKEFSTYKVGVTENSTSTMHKIASREIRLDDFSIEKLPAPRKTYFADWIGELNHLRGIYNATKNAEYFDQIIAMLPMSYNYRRTVVMNYQALRNMYHSRKNHKLQEWRSFCEWIESLPYSELITGAEESIDDKVADLPMDKYVRPCERCKHHTASGCRSWDCRFEEA